MQNENPHIVFLTVNQLQDIIETAVTKALNKQPQQDDDELIKRNEVAKLFKVSLVTVTDWTKKGLIKSYNINSRIFYKKSELLKFKTL